MITVNITSFFLVIQFLNNSKPNSTIGEVGTFT